MVLLLWEIVVLNLEQNLTETLSTCFRLLELRLQPRLPSLQLRQSHVEHLFVPGVGQLSEMIGEFGAKLLESRRRRRRKMRRGFEK